MSHTPLVSIGLPTHNRASSLRRAIESVLAQGYKNIELVISDNASTDETEAICLEYQTQRVQYFRQQNNQGPVNNFFEVLERSSGQFFMWLGDDDVLDRSYVGRCVEVLMKESDCSLACGQAKYFRGEEFVYHGMPISLRQNSGSERVVAYYSQVIDNGTFYGLMRRAQILNVPLRNTMGADWLFIAAVAFMGKVQTLEDISVERQLGGMTDSYKKIVETLGLSKRVIVHPYLSIAASAFIDIAWRCPVYSTMGMLSRLLLGFKAFLLAAGRDRTFHWMFYLKYLPRRVASRLRSMAS